MALLQMVQASGGGGVAEYATWGDLPAAPADGTLAIASDSGMLAVAQDGIWLPEPLVGARTLTRDAASFGLDEALADLTAAGWSSSGATKTAGQALVVTGTSASYAQLTLATQRNLVMLDAVASVSSGWVFCTSEVGTGKVNKRADWFVSATQVQRSSSVSVLDGPYDVGRLYLLLDFGATTPTVSWWTPDYDRKGITQPIGLQGADLEGYTTALYSQELGFYGGFSGSATWAISRCEIWAVT